MSRDPQEYRDTTPCVDYFGDKSTVGFEKLWYDIWYEIRNPLPYHKTHEIDPFTLRCRRCGVGEVTIHMEKLRCEDLPLVSSASGS